MSTGVVHGSHGAHVADDWRRVTVGTPGGGVTFGYDAQAPDTFGSINVNTYKGYTFINLWMNTDASSTFVALYFQDPNFPVNGFSRIWFQRGNGSFVALDASAAIYTNNVGGTQTFFQWVGLPGNHIWLAGDVGQVRVVKLSL